MENDICPTILLEDQPSDVDFLGGAHDRLTDAIVQLIKTEKGGRTIGIEGSWGSGKSTVIKLLSKKLADENKKIHISYFDAWAHEGDPLRRTFLEKIIDELSTKKWVRPDYWEIKKQELQGKLSTIKIDSEPQITNFGKLLIPISLLSIPIGSALINKGTDIGLSFVPNSSPNFYFIFGIVSILFPFILMIIAYLYKKNPRNTNNWINKKLELNKVTDIWSIFLQKYQQTTTSFSSQKPNPTSVEFENSFLALIDEALTDRNHSIVIILDNLDRILTSDALAILSTLQTFLQCNGESKSEFDRLWVIIPYDLNGLKKIWKSNVGDDDIISLSMIEKRIQLRFRIPPVVLSNFKEYFIKLMSQAFPTHKDSEFYQCYRIYYQSTINKKDFPTPREIKSFINQIGSFHRQWNSVDEIPLSHIAYYVLQLSIFQENKLIIEKLVTGEIPTKEYQNLLGEKVSEDIAVLIFNVEHRVAIQLLLFKPLKESLITLDEKRIDLIYENFESGFWSILESYENSDWSSLSPLNLATATISIDKIFKTKNSQPASKEIVFRSLQNAYFGIDFWPEISNFISESICIILKNFCDRKLADHIFHTIKSVTAPKNTTLSKNEISIVESKSRELCNTRIKILECLHENFYSNSDFPDKIELICSEEKSNVLGIIEFCSVLSEIEPSKKLQNLFFSRIGENDLLSVFNNIIDNGLFSYRYIHSIPIINNFLQGINWGSSKYQIQQRILLHPEIPNGALIEGLWIFQDFDIPSDKTEFEITQIFSALLSNLDYAFIQEEFISVSWILIYFLLKGKSTEYYPGIDHSQEGYDKLIDLFSSSSIQAEILPVLVPKIKEYHLLEPWVEVTSKLNITHKLSSEILSFMNIEDDQSEEITGSFIIDFWEKIAQIFELADKLDSFILQSSKKIPYGDLIIGSSFASTKASLYSSLIRCNLQFSKKIKKWVIHNLLGFNSDFWLEELITENDCIRLVMTLVENDENEFLNIEFQEGIEKYAVSVISGESQPKIELERWFRIFDALKHNNRLVLRKNLVDAMKNVESINPNFFAYFGSELLDQKTIIQDTDVIRRVFTGQFIDKKDANGLSWLLSLIEKYPSIIFDYPLKEDVNYFIEKITQAVKIESEGQYRNLCLAICEKLNIDISHFENNFDQAN